MNTIFVTGVTGNQGSNVAAQLAANGFNVVALTRNPNSPKAQKLNTKNIRFVKGDLNDGSTYKAYLKDVFGVFSVQTFVDGVEKEINQGITLATFAKESGVKHFLYSSVVGAASNTGVPHFESKFKIENFIRQMGMPYTILRPTSFFENFLIPQVKKGILKGKLVQPINKNTVLQYIAAEDIGKVAVKIFQEVDAYAGQTIPLASEQLATQQVAEIFSSVLQKEIKYQKLPGLITRLLLGKDLYKMFKWMDENSSFTHDDVNLTKTAFPELISLESWVAKHFKI